MNKSLIVEVTCGQVSENLPVLRARNVSKSYENGRIPVLHGISLDVFPGECVALWGESGSGKSTLLHLLGGLDVPQGGEIEVAGLCPCHERDRLKLRREKVGFVFQLHNLIHGLNVEENCRIPALGSGLSRGESTRRIEALLCAVALLPRRHQQVQKLSGGERQRVAICRALVNRPRVVLADEPTGSLDETTGDKVFGLLASLAKQEGVTVVLATHERRVAEACDRVFHLRQGKLTALK